MATVIDAYAWRATYHDDIQVPEFDQERPRGRGFAEIDSAQVKMIELVDLAQNVAHRVHIPSGAEPVFVRRRATEVNPNNGSKAYLGSAHCIGWKRGNIGCYLFVLWNGSTLMTDDFQAV